MKFIIVAGTNKSGTTSLFNYLAGHPTVTSSSMKQTDFFLQENVIFEDYLLVFLLRKPEDRLLSWFKYSKQLFLIPQDMTFSKYIELNQKNQDPSIEEFSALQTGNYVDYLERFYSVFDRSQIKIIFTEDLKENPTKLMSDLATELGINADFYSSYNFEIFNKSQNSRNKSLRTFYLFLRNLFLPLAKSNFKFLSKIVYKIGKAVSGLYRKINLTKKAVDVNIQDADYALISDYYKRSNEKLSALIGEKLPWNTGK